MGEFALQQIRGSSHQLFRRLTCRNDHLRLRDGDELTRTSRHSAAQACVEIAGVCSAVEVRVFVFLKDTFCSSFLLVQQTSLQLHWLLSNMFFPLAGFKCGLCYFLPVLHEISIKMRFQTQQNNFLAMSSLNLPLLSEAPGHR